MDYGNIEGHVTDVIGDVLPGVIVEAASEALEGARTTVTNAEGRYRLVELPPGGYEVTFQMDGFATARKSCRVEAGGTAECDAALKLADVG